MDNNSQISNLNSGSLSFPDSHNSKQIVKTLQNKQNQIISIITNQEKISSQKPQIILIFERIMPYITEIFKMNSLNLSETIPKVMISIFNHIMPIILEVENFAEYLEYQENKINIFTIKDNIVDCGQSIKISLPVNENTVTSRS